MKSLSKKKKILILILIILCVFIVLASLYRLDKIKLLDKSQYKEMASNLENNYESFESQKDLRNYITSWADSIDLKYTIDNNKNIIFTQEAISKKKHVSPTVVLVNYNYENIEKNINLLTSAAMIASTKLDSGKKTVIFVNNKNNDGDSYYNLNPAYFSNKAKVIYLDYGNQTYISERSFYKADQTITIPAEHTEVTCDTAIKIKIKGLKTDCIDANISKNPNVITMFSSILTRLKSKSTICQLSNIKISQNGYMYPNKLEATILLNSYSVESFTKYLDGRIKKFEKSYKDDNPECEYSYKIIKNENKFPDYAYKKSTFNTLTTVLFALKNGAIRFSDEDEDIPEGYNVNDICILQCPYQLRSDEDNIYIDVLTQGLNKENLNLAMQDVKNTAKLSKCTATTNAITNEYHNKKTKLLRTLQTTYFKVSDMSGSCFSLSEDYDTYFTPMSYINKLNKKIDMVHIKENDTSSKVITNMLLCYIQTKGNFLSL